VADLFWATINLVQTGCFIYHPDRNFQGVLNIQSEIWNSACGSTYGYIGRMCFSHITGKVIFTNQDDLYIILTHFSRRFWIWTWKFEIQPVAAHMAILYYDPFWEKYNLHQSGCSIHHPYQNSKRVLNIQPEILNLACGNKYGYICIMCSNHTATLRGNLTSTNHGDLYIILT
jgi:hypothetical protein